MSKIEDNTTTSSTTTPKPKTPWPRRREMDLKAIQVRVDKVRGLLKNVSPEAYKTEGIDAPWLVDTLERIDKDLKAVVTVIHAIPDSFPPKTLRVASGPEEFAEGNPVQVRKNKQDKYVGAFDATKPLKVGKGKVGGNYVPVVTGDGATFFIATSHLLHLPKDAA